jgi:hypothetical protein
MAKSQLDNLAAIGKLKREPPVASEIDGLIRSGEARLADAENPTLSIESRFDLAYNAAHALSLAALRWHGYDRGRILRQSDPLLTQSLFECGDRRFAAPGLRDVSESFAISFRNLAHVAEVLPLELLGSGHLR